MTNTTHTTHTTHTLTRFRADATHADTILGGYPSEAAARAAMRAAMLGQGEGLEVIDDARGVVVATRGAKRP
jgi:hypothetical protein